MDSRNLFAASDTGAGGLSFVAVGDSFTEGLNDPAPGGGFRGWADRLAAMLAVESPALRYANLAVRGKLLRQIVGEQVPAALTLLEQAATRPGTEGCLVGIAGGGNDILRPGGDPDTLAELFDAAVARLREDGCRVLMFTGFDPVAFPVLRLLRGRIAAYDMHLRAIADNRGCDLVDLWSMRFLRDPAAWSSDRLHLTADSHRRVALRAAEVLGTPVTEDWRVPLSDERKSAEVADTLAEPHAAVALASRAAVSSRGAWVTARREDARWAKEYFLPWINRRLHGTSSGDDVTPKRPDLRPVTT
jgi:lysophospholipase L1-like esterase